MKIPGALPAIPKNWKPSPLPQPSTHFHLATYLSRTCVEMHRGKRISLTWTLIGNIFTFLTLHFSLNYAEKVLFPFWGLGGCGLKQLKVA